MKGRRFYRFFLPLSLILNEHSSGMYSNLKTAVFKPFNLALMKVSVNSNNNRQDIKTEG
jgi:hypothetical protein